MINPIPSSGGFPTGISETARTPEEAARQFEEVLVKEFVRTMTKDVFGGSLGGDDTPAWVRSQGQAQGETLADEVTRHLVDQGTLGIADMLLRQWNVKSSAIDPLSEATPPGETLPGETPPGERLPGTPIPIVDPESTAPFALAPVRSLSLRPDSELP